jgi:hypothetical protein
LAFQYPHPKEKNRKFGTASAIMQRLDIDLTNR